MKNTTPYLQSNRYQQPTDAEMKSLLDNLPGMAYHCLNDAKWTMTYVSYGCCALTGYNPNMLINNAAVCYSDMIHDEDLSRVRNEIRVSIEKKSPFQLMYRIITRHGQLKWVWEQGRGVFSNNKQLLYLEGFIIDITQRIAIEDQLKQSQKALILSEEKFFKVFEYSPDAILISRADDGVVLDVNQAFIQLTGYSYDDMIGKSIHKLPIRVQSDDISPIRTNQQVTEHESLVRTKDDRLVPVTVSETMTDVCGESVVLTIARDISLKKRMEQEIIKAKEAAEIANQAKTDFLAAMSHEIRTPMNVILGFSEILLNNTQDIKERSYLSNIYSNGKVLLSIINDILDLTKIEAGKLEIQPDLVNIRDLIAEIELIFSQKIKEKGLRFCVDISPDVPDGLMLDEIRIRQILINLISNAIKFTLDGYIKLSINCDYLNPEADKVNLQFVIEDTGIGISNDQIRLIFESFHQQKGQKVKQYGGSGLGLSITKKLVELMNGSISVASEAGKGAAFTVNLYDVDVVDIAYDTISLTEESKEVIFKQSAILVVDDSMSNRGLIKAYLENTNVTVFEAENGNSALSFLKTSRHLPDLILMDLIMPDKDGYEMLSLIRKDQRFSHIPIVAFTAFVMKEEEQRIRSVFNGYLPKPVSRDQVFQELQKFLPYDEIISESNTVVPESKVIEIPASLYNRLPDIIQELKDRYIPLRQDIEDGYFIDDIEIFANDLLRCSVEYQFEYLQQFSRHLQEYIRSNQVDEMERMIREFSFVLDSLQRAEDKKEQGSQMNSKKVEGKPALGSPLSVKGI